MKQRWLATGLLVGLTILLFASCSLTANTRSDQVLSGRMLLWHSLSEREAEAINQVISSFSELNPDVTIKVQRFTNADELRQQFTSAAASGLGPDVILAPSAWLKPLADAQVISPIDTYLGDDILGRFNAASLGMLKIGEETYGLPQRLDTLALYVNKSLVETPTNSFAGLLEQANAGTTILLPINFIDAFWGIQAFGGRLFNDEGQVILDQGGFANWLAWLRDARSAPGMIQDTNRGALRQRFTAGNAGYYVGYASELNEILTALTLENVTVLSLPAGPVAPAGPFVSSQAFFFSSVSSANQRLLATEFAKFVTNAEQSARLMRTVYHVPANMRVRINPRLDPIVAAFAGQARNALPVPVRPEFDAVVRLGNEAYIRTLEGGELPAEVAFGVNNMINEANGFAVQAEPNYTCTSLGTIELAHTWQQADDLNALDQIIADFREICPLVIVETVAVETNELLTRFTAARSTGGSNSLHSTLALVSQTELAQLAAPEARVMNLNTLISPDMLQRFSPIGIEAMRFQGNLYGLPFGLDVDALYYNRQMVAMPAQTLDDLRAQATSGIPITLDTRFEHSIWGISLFGGKLIDANGAATLDQGGMADWLTWLRDSRDLYSIALSNDEEDLRNRFLNGTSAYYIAGSDELPLLMDALGENLGVALLPSGPAGPAQPLVQAEGFVLREGTTEASRNLALEFMRFATDLQSQTLLMNEANKTAANVTVSTAEARAFAVFVEQAQAGFLQPNTPYWQPLVELGQAAYVDVLEEGLDPIAVVAELTQAINLANGIVVAEPTLTPLPPVEDEPIESKPVEQEDDALPATVTPEAEPKDETIATPTQNSPAERPGNSEP